MYKDEVILKSIAKAVFWKAQIDANIVRNLSEIAAEGHISVRYARKIYQLNYLMPDIVRALLKGENPNRLTIEDFKKIIPISWTEQYIWFFGKE